MSLFSDLGEILKVFSEIVPYFLTKRLIVE